LQHDLLFLANDLELNHHHHHQHHHHHGLHVYHHHQHVSSTSDNEDSNDATEAAPVVDFERTLAHLLTERQSKVPHSRRIDKTHSATGQSRDGIAI
jgi:hypothetical protein